MTKWLQRWRRRRIFGFVRVPEHFAVTEIVNGHMVMWGRVDDGPFVVDLSAMPKGKDASVVIEFADEDGTFVMCDPSVERQLEIAEERGWYRALREVEALAEHMQGNGA